MRRVQVLLLGAILLLMPFSSQGEAFNPKYDRPELILGYKEKAVKNIYEMDEKRGQDGGIAIAPWTSDYWATAHGGIAHRYTDPVIKNILAQASYEDQYHKAYNYYISTAPTQKLLNSNQINQLSPAEKYDLLMGDTNFTLSKDALNAGKSQMEDGYVPLWAGICHGWALAALKEKAPRKTVTLTDVTGKYRINFYPHDIRALASQYYGAPEAGFDVAMTGINCLKTDVNSGAPGDNYTTVDPNTGRVLDPECNDTNPGSFHTVMVNSVGFRKKSFVIDHTFDAEVWNQPVYKYSLRYFNPSNNKKSYWAKDAMVPVSQFKNDKFAKYRDPRTAYIVGVNAQVTYTQEVVVTHASSIPEAHDRLISKVEPYKYDLELDAAGNIIGGEWHSKKHPDFLFAPSLNPKPKTYFEAKVFGNSIQERMKRGRAVVRQASQKTHAPLYGIVEKLIELSQ